MELENLPKEGARGGTRMPSIPMYTRAGFGSLVGGRKLSEPAPPAAAFMCVSSLVSCVKAVKRRPCLIRVPPNSSVQLQLTLSAPRLSSVKCATSKCQPVSSRLSTFAECAPHFVLLFFSPSLDYPPSLFAAFLY